MNELNPGNLYAFLKRFQLKGGRLLRFQVRPRKADGSTADLQLRAVDTQSNKPIRLRLAFEFVEEYRFQRRPGTTSAKLNEVQFGFFGDLTYLNLDAFAIDGPPKVMDFRASDCFIAGRIVRWEIVEKKSVT
jgi:hypothetical protein